MAQRPLEFGRGRQGGSWRDSSSWRLPARLGRSDWSRVEHSVSGPVAVLLLAILLDQLERHGVLGFNPMPLLLLAVAGAGLRGGAAPGIVAGVLAALYAVHFYANPGIGLHYQPAPGRDLAVAAVTAPLLGALAGQAARIARSRLTHLHGAPLTPRLDFAEGATSLIASSLDYQGTLQAVARRAVSSVADWCVIHLVAAEGEPVGIAAAHTDAAREVFVQGLRRYPPCGFPNEVPGGGSIRSGAAARRDWARDDEHQRLLEALASVTVAAVPLQVAGRTVGLVVAGTDTSGRELVPDDLAALRVMAEAAAGAVERSRLGAALAAAEQEHRFVFESHPAALWILDAETLAFLAVNEAAVRLYGWSQEEFRDLTLLDLRPPEEPATPAFESREAARSDVAATQHRRRDGSLIDVEITSRPIQYRGRRARIALVADVTDRLRARAALHQSEERRRHAQRMDAVGRLAGGVAHDFNNLLTAIQGYSEMLLRGLPDPSPHRGDAEEILKAAERGAMLSRQLLAFGERERVQPRSVDLNAVVAQMESLIQRLLGADVQVVIDRAPEVPAMRIDPALLEQVLVSLVLNAREAMPRGGTLTIETGEREIAPGSRSRSLKPGRYTVLSVSDTGDNAELGGALELPIVYNIVRQTGGVVRVTSEPGHGTTVRAYFPTTEGDDATTVDEMPRRGDETVLVVEDEEPVRELLRKVLSRQGYTVLEARHGRDALRVLERHRGPLDLMVTDVVMPEMGGAELAENVRLLRPDLRTLFISGYTNDEVVRRGADAGDAAFIQKPFTSDELLRAVRELLDKSPLSS